LTVFSLYAATSTEEALLLLTAAHTALSGIAEQHAD